MKKNAKRKVKKYHWLITLVVTVVVSMWVYGNTKHYFPDPVDIGFGQYFDVGTGIVIFTLVISGFIVAALFTNKNKKQK